MQHIYASVVESAFIQVKACRLLDTKPLIEQRRLIVKYTFKTNFNMISIGIQTFSLKKCCLQSTRQISQSWPNWPELTRLRNHSPWHMIP